MSVLCPQCGAPANEGATNCQYCGAAIAQAAPQAAPAAQAQPQVIVVNNSQPVDERASWPVKSKIVAALLAFFLGGLGVHKFYLGQAGMGIVYILFCWTGIPAFIAFFEFIILLCTSDENFSRKYRCRTN